MKRAWLVVLWICLGAAILGLDYLAGPDVALPYLFLIPVGLAAHYNGRFWGVTLAIILPLTRFCFHFTWEDPYSLWDMTLNIAIRTAILVGAAILIDRVTRQSREIRVLRGFLPICSFCKKIRAPDQQWHPLETYITEHSEAKFSHGFCPECGRKYYGDLSADEKASIKPPDSPP
jgi:hypothetical protein